jgi:hypothetical protein
MVGSTFDLIYMYKDSGSLALEMFYNDFDVDFKDVISIRTLRF